MENNMYQNPYEYTQSAAPESTMQEAIRQFFTKVYGWMAVGLAMTGLTAYVVATTPSLLEIIVYNQFIFFGLIIAELALVIGLSALINKMSAFTATMLFMLYALMNGLTFSVIFLVYELGSIMQVFLITGCTFAVMSFYGFITKKDLTSWGNILSMGLIGLIIAFVVNFFILKSAMFDMVISFIGVLIFVGLTAYDTWKLKQVAQNTPGAPENIIQKSAIIGALKLYLDFINLMLMLLRLMGSRR